MRHFFQPAIVNPSEATPAFRPHRDAPHEVFDADPVTKRLRRVVWEYYHRYFHPRDPVLELGCGSGSDALELAANGIHVVATDASALMIAELHEKIEGTALRPFVTPMHLSLQRLAALHGTTFDGAYANFGALNCTNRLPQVARDLALLVKPGKHLVLTLLSDFSLWETVSLLCRGHWRRAFRRRHPEGDLAEVRGEKVLVHYYSPRRAREMFSPYFEFVESRGLNVISPPRSATLVRRVLGRATHLLDAVEDSLPPTSRLHGWGDQYVMVFRRKEK